MTESSDEKIIFIDRDGVINVDLMGDYIKHWGEFKFEVGALEGLKVIHDAGYKIIIISNQAGIGSGEFTEAALWDVHNNMLKELEKIGVHIEDTHYCFSRKNDATSTHRKPKTGMFEDAVQKNPIDKARTYFVGDKATDIEAGKRFGIKTAFVRTGHGVNDEALLVNELEPDLKAENLLDAVNQILKES